MKYRPPVIQPDGQRDDHEQGRQHHQRQPGGQPVEHRLDQLLAAGQLRKHPASRIHFLFRYAAPAPPPPRARHHPSARSARAVTAWLLAEHLY